MRARDGEGGAPSTIDNRGCRWVRFPREVRGWLVLTTRCRAQEVRFILKTESLQQTQGTHALIFSSFASEMSKSRVIDKVTALMPLSREEAYDLVNRTPIVVLDDLSRSEAEKLRDYFLTEGCEVVLTEDQLIKRKCYRIMWQERPELDYEKSKKETTRRVEEKRSSEKSITPKTSSARPIPTRGVSTDRSMSPVRS